MRVKSGVWRVELWCSLARTDLKAPLKGEGGRQTEGLSRPFTA